MKDNLSKAEIRKDAVQDGVEAVTHAVGQGTQIVIDAVSCELTVQVGEAEMAQRRAAWTAPAAKATSGVLSKYVRLVRSASEGCVTD